MIVKTGQFKTTEVLNSAHMTNTIVVVFNKNDKDRLMRFTEESGYKIFDIITFEELVSRPTGNNPIIIDNIDLCLESMFGSVKMITSRKINKFG